MSQGAWPVVKTAVIFLGQLLQALLFPPGVVLVLLLAALVLRKRKKWGTGYLVAATAIFWLAGAGWTSNLLLRPLERHYLSPNPVPNADAIVVLGGGSLPKQFPRQTVELDEAGDRLVYGAHLFRQGKAPVIICTGGLVPGSGGDRPVAEEMKEFLEMIGTPGDAIVVEPKARNTREHPVFCQPIFQQRSIHKILLVTSATHMPRSVAVFRRSCPGLDVVPAPTDFQVAEPAVGIPIWKQLKSLVPSVEDLRCTTVALHEYFGIAYYKLRGWM